MHSQKNGRRHGAYVVGFLDLAGSLTLLLIIMEVEMSPSNCIFLAFGAVFHHDYGRKGKDLVVLLLVLPKHRNSTNSPGILWSISRLWLKKLVLWTVLLRERRKPRDKQTERGRWPTKWVNWYPFSQNYGGKITRKERKLILEISPHFPGKTMIVGGFG